MRTVRLIGGAAWMLALSLTARAGSVPYQATVIVPEVDVRCLPSATANSYPTSKLQQGATVEVLEEKEGGWLAIKPPPGSFSWVQTRLLDRLDPNFPYNRILAERAEVRVGSRLVNRKPDVVQVQPQRGTQVVILDWHRTYDDEDGKTGGWVMIQPPPQEVRYIPANAVRPANPVQTVSSAPPAVGSHVSSASPPEAVPDAQHGQHVPIEDPLWLQAKQAEKEGKYAEAESLYLQLAKQTTDHNLCIRCYNHIHYMKSRMQATTPAAWPPPAPANPVAAGENRIVPTATIPYPQTVKPAPAPMGQATSQYTYVRETAVPVVRAASASTTVAAAVPAPPPQAAGPAQTLGPGLLVRSISPVAGQKAYMLERGEGQPIVYILPAPGVNLEPYANTRVSVSGSLAYHAGYRREVLTAVQVTPQP